MSRIECRVSATLIISGLMMSGNTTDGSNVVFSGIYAFAKVASINWKELVQIIFLP